MPTARFINDTTTVTVKSDNIGARVNVSSYPPQIDHRTLSNRDLPDQHPIDAISGLEEALRRADTFVFEQAVASDIWEIEHNLNKYPSVTVVDSAGTQFTAKVEYNSLDKCTIYINGITTGKAFLN